MSALWIYKSQNIILTKLETRVKNAIGTKYPEMYFTNDPEKQSAETYFPTIYCGFMGGSEQGKSLSGKQINAYTCSIQVNVTASKSQGVNGAKEVAWNVAEAFLKMGFEITSTPQIIETGNDTKVCTIRVRRLIAYNDLIP